MARVASGPWRYVATALWLLLALAAHTAGAAVVEIGTAQVAPAGGTEPPPDAAAWTMRQLPDASRPGGGGRWYRMAFDRPATAAGQAWAVWLPYLYEGGDVWLNGMQVGQVPETSPTRTVRWERPHLFALPASLLRTGANELAVRAADGAAQQVLRFPRVSVGPLAEVQRRHDVRFFWVRTMPQLTVVVCLLVSGFVTFIWWRRRSEVLYGLFGLATALWGLRTLTFVVEQLPTGHWLAWRLAYVGATGGFIVVMAVFSMRYAGLRKPWVERALALYAVAGPVWLAAGGHTADAVVNRYWLGGLIPVALAVLGLSVWALVRQRTLAAGVVPAAIAAAVLAGIHDYLVAWDAGSLARWLPGWADHRIFLLHHGANLLLLAMGGLLTARFVQALASLEELNHTLESRVADREAHLAANYRRMVSLQEENAATQERQRIMREIHDGLGSRLFTSLSRVQRGDMDNRQIAQALRECIEDMRLALDALTPGEDHDLRTVLGNFLFRWRAQLEDAGVRSAWTIDDPEGLAPLPSQVVLQLLRIAQEALTNVLRHAQATQVEVTLHHAATLLTLEVVDDGRAAAAKPNDVGRGLGNMRARAAALGGALTVEHRPQGTRVALRVPLPAAATTAR